MVIYLCILYCILLFLLFLILDYPPNGRGIIGGLELFNTKIYLNADSFVYLCRKFMFNLIFGIMKESKIGYQVFECSRFGGKHSVSKIFPTYLGCMRVRNRISRENCSLDCYRYTIECVNY